MMSSPNHPTSNIEDTFSSNFPDYILASPDYSPASSRNTSSESSNNSYGLVLIVSPTLSLFHDDPYMEVMHAYDTIIPPQEILPLKKRGRERSSSFTSAYLKHLRWEKVLIRQMPPKRTSTSATPAMTQAAIRQLVADSVVAALEAQAANMANTDNTNRNTKTRETPATRKCTYKEFMSCQLFNFKGTEGVIGLIRWFERPNMEDEFYHLNVKGNDLKTYVRRFQELETLCPTMVSNSEKMMEAFIKGLPRSIEGNVTASKPQILEEAINIA
nr:reverse transcriptase domain-containing protein [Tanacetum cinerariifolium]